jgi:WD40 repeat protein
VTLPSLPQSLRPLVALALALATPMLALACRAPEQRDCGDDAPKAKKGSSAKKSEAATSTHAEPEPSVKSPKVATSASEEPAEAALPPIVAASSAVVSPATPWPPPNPGRTAFTPANAASIKERWSTSIGGWGKIVAVSGAHDRVVATSGSTLELLDARTGAKLASRAESYDDVILAIGWGPKSVVVATHGRIDELDPKTLDLLATTKVRASPAHAAAIVWPGVAMSHDDGVLARYTLGGVGVYEIPIGGPPVQAHSIALSRDGRRVVVGFIQGTVWAWDWATPVTPLKLAQHSGHLSVAFSASGAYVVESGSSFGVAIHRVDKRGVAPRKARTDASWTNGLAIDDTGKLVIAGSSSGYLTIAGDEEQEPHRLSKGWDTVESLSVDEWLTSFAGIDRSGLVRFYAIDPAPSATGSASTGASGSAAPKPSAPQK